MSASSIPVNAATETKKPRSQFHPIEQPLAVKLGVTLGGIALIAAEYWWFILSQKKEN